MEARLLTKLKKVANKLARKHPSNSADDLLQEGVIGVLGAMPRHVPGSSPTFLVARGVGAMLDSLRKGGVVHVPRLALHKGISVKQGVPELSTQPALPTDSAASLIADYAKRSGVCLTSDELDVLVKRFGDDMTYKAIGRSRNESEAYVHSMLHTILQRFREKLCEKP